MPKYSFFFPVNRRTRRFFLSISCLLTSFMMLSSGGIALASDFGSAINEQTVKIRVKHREGLAIGSGIILCQRNSEKCNEVYILSAKHVLFGGNPPFKEKETSRRFQDISDIRVEFYKDRWSRIKGDLTSFDIKRTPNKDLALLKATNQGKSLTLTKARIDSSYKIEPFPRL